MDRPPTNPKNAAALAGLVATCNPDAPVMRAYAEAQAWRAKALDIINTAAATGSGFPLVSQYENALAHERARMRDFLKATPRAIDQALFKTAVLLLDHEAGLPPWYFRYPGERFDLIREQLKSVGERVK
jgi:hypothetical protein